MNKVNVKFLKNAISNEKGVNYLSIDLFSKQLEVKEEVKKPNLFIFLLDNSGSMDILGSDRELTRIDFAKRAISNFIDNLDEQDKLGLITFNSRVDLIIPLTHPTKKISLKNKVKNIYTTGCTNMGIGFDLSREMISKRDLDKYNCKIIVLSDGDINEGKDYKELVKDSEHFLKSGISISSIGIGDSYNSQLMNDICTSLFYHLKTLSSLDDILKKELSLNNKILYNNVKVKIKCDGLVELKENINDYKEKEYDNSKTIYVGNLISNINKNILIPINNDLEKDDINFEVNIEFTKEEIVTIKKTLKVVSKESLIEYEEDEKIFELVTEYLKRKTIQESSLNYMQFGDIGKVNSINKDFRNNINSLSSSMGIIPNLKVTNSIESSINEVNSVSMSYGTSQSSDLKDFYCKYSNRNIDNI